VLLDIFLKGKRTGIDLAKQLREDNIAFIYLSANSNEEILAEAKTTEPDGFIVKPFREKDLLVTLEIAQYRHEHSRESKYRREVELIPQLEKTITDNTEWKQKLAANWKNNSTDSPFDFLTAEFDYADKALNHAVSFLRIGFNEYQTIGLKELSNITSITPGEIMKLLFANGYGPVSAFFNDDAFEEVTQKSSLGKLTRETFNMKSALSFPLLLKNENLFTLTFYGRRPDTYSVDHIALLNRLHPTLTKVIEQMPVENIGAGIKSQEKQESLLYSNINAIASGFEGIIGSSHLLLNVFDQITQVAPFDTAVLILGESGTGKEKIADCIHKLSPRKAKPLVKINCATLPATLIESELFGHEKGSFTGATIKEPVSLNRPMAELFF
jgi:CheY-like chemotaxis protein